MAVPKILLYYAFAPVADPEAVRLWQRALCESLGLRGRILISSQGINGTVGGELEACKAYARATAEYAPFAGLDVKWSEGTGFEPEDTKRTPKRRPVPWLQSSDFPGLVVKVREEIVSFGAPEALRVDAAGVVGGGIPLSPDQVHELVDARGDDVVFFDGRNQIEAQIGRFRGAIVPPVETTRDFVSVLDSGAYDHLKDRPIVTYCTGGIRCEVLSSLMIDRGFSEVYQIAGGIVRYGERYGDDGLWDGSLYVFDGRGSMDFTGDAAVIGVCVGCGAATSRTANCVDASCRTQAVVCESCDALPCAAHAVPASA
ncbi:MAG: rhodanese-related sulfurtransferase [Microbacteriaceae bacterium]